MTDLCGAMPKPERRHDRSLSCSQSSRRSSGQTPSRMTCALERWARRGAIAGRQPGGAARLIILAAHEKRFTCRHGGCDRIPRRATRTSRGAFSSRHVVPRGAGTTGTVDSIARRHVARSVHARLRECGRAGDTGHALGHCGAWRGAADRVVTARRIERELEREGD